MRYPSLVLGSSSLVRPLVHGPWSAQRIQDDGHRTRDGRRTKHFGRRTGCYENENCASFVSLLLLPAASLDVVGRVAFPLPRRDGVAEDLLEQLAEGELAVVAV